MTDRAAARFLDQATWGPSQSSIVRLQQMGIQDWLEWQFSLNVSDIPDQPLSALSVLPVQTAFLQNAIQGEDQLRQRVAFALSKIWVVSSIQFFDEFYAFPPYWRIFRDNAFRNYRDIIRAVTLNPAMGHYLNQVNSFKGNPLIGSVPNQNYARELMQLFTIGLVRLNLDGTPVLDANQNPIPTFNASDVANMANALTGWTYPAVPGAATLSVNPPYYFGEMIPSEQRHDTTTKTILGNITLPSGQTAGQDLNSVIDALMQQDTMAPFICRQLIQQLVTSNPSPAYVRRVSAVFVDNGSGIRGDMKGVVTAILTDTEARADDHSEVLSNPTFGHLREPVLFIVNVLRSLNGAMSKNSSLALYARKLGQEPFRAPSVFSYFSPQHKIESGLFGPEFQIYSTQTSIDRVNFINDVLGGGLDANTSIDLTPFRAFSSDIPGLLEHISSIFLHHSMSRELYQAAYSAANAAEGRSRVEAALYIVLTSGEYQVLR